MQADTATVVIGESRDAARRAARPGRWFFVGLALAAAVAVFLGFSRSYYLKSFFFAEVSFTPLFHIHGVLFSAWFLLLVLQAWLAASRRIAPHRRVGSIGAWLVVPMLVSGVLAAIAAAQGEGPMTAAIARGELPAMDLLPRPEILAINLRSMLLFGAFAGAALALRGRPAVHKRFMVLATVAMLPSAIGRAMLALFGAPQPVLVLGATALFVLAMMIHDRRTQGRMHPVTLWAGLGLLLSFPAGLALARTDFWVDFAEWLVR